MSDERSNDDDAVHRLQRIAENLEQAMAQETDQLQEEVDQNDTDSRQGSHVSEMTDNVADEDNIDQQEPPEDPPDRTTIDTGAVAQALLQNLVALSPAGNMSIAMACINAMIVHW